MKAAAPSSSSLAAQRAPSCALRAARPRVARAVRVSAVASITPAAIEQRELGASGARFGGSVGAPRAAPLQACLWHPAPERVLPSAAQAQRASAAAA